MSSRRLLILSPHSDDTAFSLGGLLATGSVFQGWHKHQLTLFVRSRHAPCAPDLNSVEAITKTRCREDDAFCGYHNIVLQRLDFEETLLRGYPSIDSIFMPRPPTDDALFERTCEEVARAVVGADSVLAPLGIGGHIEHILVREACRRARPDALYYEDLPYAGDFSNAELDSQAITFGPDFQCRCVDIEAGLCIKSARLLGYASQVVASDLEKVIAYSWRRRPALALTTSLTQNRQGAVEVLWGRPSALAMIDQSTPSDHAAGESMDCLGIG